MSVASRASERPAPPISAPDILLAIGLALLFTLLFAANAQSRMHGDASWMLVALANAGKGNLLHPLLHPVHVALDRIVGDPRRTAYLISHLSGGIGLGATYLLIRAALLPRLGALFATLLLAGTPALWFFATTIEVHALQFAAAACTGCAVLLAPWRRPWLALPLTLIGLPFVHASHQFSVLMGFGWPALVRWAHQRSGRSLTWVRAYLVYGPLALATLVATQVVIGRARQGHWTLDVGAETTIISQYHDPAQVLGMAWQGWIVCLGAFLPVGLYGLLRGAGRGEEERWIPLLFWLLPLFFLLFVYPVPERGGFLLGSAPFFALHAARALRTTSQPALALASVLIGLQLGLGWYSVHEFDQGFDPDERVVVVREVMGESGMLLVGDHLAPVLHHFLPELLEVDAVAGMRGAAYAEGASLTEPRPVGLEPLLRAHVGQRPVAIDLSYGTSPDRHTFILNDPTEGDRAWMDAFVAWVEQHCVTRRHEHPSWPILEVVGWRE